MSEHEGVLKMLGNAKIYPLGHRYSVIEFDNKIFTDVLVPTKLDNFLQRGLETNKPIKVWIMKMGFGNKTIPCFELDGKKYCSAPFGFGDLFFMTFLSLIFLLVSLFGDFPSIVKLIFVPVFSLGVYTMISPVLSYSMLALKADVKL
ncbi:hypothetical protein BDD18_3275 [Acidovorax temperans]|uniref:Uncharacterized protein n=1 Tax=Acidovorax temperans TaxID=80878 RepID=A0A543L1V2_9BURK|nr:hypothetical protein [Acidovorax temperans]MDD4942492.1 hypothetical protein [Rhodoferax sp.]TQN01318.1 hypothetical protein BDD18_3275 [Acidovorax temperans]